MKLTSYKKCLKPTTLILIGIILGWNLKYLTQKTLSEPIYIRDNAPSNKFINPVLYTEIDKNTYTQYKPLEDELDNYIASTTKDKNVDQVSVYFRDLNTGRWTGSNENEKYNPGSMLKVAVLIGYLREAESDPAILAKKLFYTATVDPGQYYKPTVSLPTGYYTIEQLIYAMILESDNEATKILVQNDDKAYVAVENELQLPKATDNPNIVDFMSARQYSSVFRVLYNSTYLDRPVSDQVLQLLSQTSFKKGLVAGVPDGTTVSHKFGEHTETYNNIVTSRELHDCGIVYYPNKPYFLCVMTKGKDFSKMEGVVSGISRVVYESVKNYEGK